ncbi:MAG: hypothetical protein PHI06_09090, partial [Desulfobulbaceae bacterium]|nr:hypothetical protein [Desulfobulbaceae bacterium]
VLFRSAVIDGVAAIDKGQIDPARNIHAWWCGIAKRRMYTAIRRHPSEELSADFAPCRLLPGHFTDTRCAQ